MFRKQILFLWIAVLILSGCASSKTPCVQQIPPLDSSLAADCSQLPEPPNGDYDELTGWMMDVIGRYGDCAARHSAIVRVWKSLESKGEL